MHRRIGAEKLRAQNWKCLGERRIIKSTVQEMVGHRPVKKEGIVGRDWLDREEQHHHLPDKNNRENQPGTVTHKAALSSHDWLSRDGTSRVSYSETDELFNGQARSLFSTAIKNFTVMPANTDTPVDSAIPLCVDMDGTLIKTDVLWESLRLLIQRNPLYLFAVLTWWLRGRAFLKQRIASHVDLNPATLPYLLPFLEYLKREHAAGRRLILASAADRRLAEIVARHVGVFSEVIASDGCTNVRGAAKGRVLCETVAGGSG